jgi:adenylate cyclase, class 2
MLEIELKFRENEWDNLIARLQELGGHRVGTQRETDSYFNPPDRDLRQTDEVVRLRCVHDVGILTYKGPKRPGAIKTREEIEVPIASGTQPIADLKRWLEALRYRPVAVVRKNRTLFTVDRAPFVLHVCFDEVDQIGRFVEVEILAEEQQLEVAEDALKNFATELGLVTLEHRAYLRMVLEAQGEQ